MLISSAAPSHLATELLDSSPTLLRVSLPSSAYDHCAPPAEHRMPASPCEILSDSSTCPSEVVLLAAGSSNHVPEKS